ncbi:MAG: hypothetical protein ACI31R_05545 [Bacilli bacterium]
MNKTKKELYHENIKLRKYLNFWIGIDDENLDLKEVEKKFNNQKNKLIIMKKIFISLAILFLCASCYILGLIN